MTTEDDESTTHETVLDEPSTDGSAASGDVEGRNERRWLPALLIVLAAVIAIVSTMTTWVRTELLDTDEWVEVSSDLLAEPEVQSSLTTYLSNQIFERIDLQTGLEDLLPEALTPLAGTVTGLLREPITDGIGAFISSERFAELWANANRAAHTQMVAILRDETGPAISAADGAVTLELGDIVRQIGENLGLPSGVLDRIPPDAGQVVIFESDQLASAQRVVQIFDVLSWFLFVVVVVLYVAAVAVARGRRIVVLRNVGLSLVAAGVVLLILRAIGIRAMTTAVIDNPEREPLATLVASVATELLRETSWMGVVYGLLIAAFAWLIGDNSWARSVRGVLGRATEATGVAIGAAAFAILLMLWWSPGRVFERWVTAITFIAMVVAAVVVLLVKSRRERLAATEPVV